MATDWDFRCPIFINPNIFFLTTKNSKILTGSIFFFIILFRSKVMGVQKSIFSKVLVWRSIDLANCYACLQSILLLECDPREIVRHCNGETSHIYHVVNRNSIRLHDTLFSTPSNFASKSLKS